MNARDWIVLVGVIVLLILASLVVRFLAKVMIDTRFARLAAERDRRQARRRVVTEQLNRRPESEAPRADEPSTSGAEGSDETA